MITVSDIKSGMLYRNKEDGRVIAALDVQEYPDPGGVYYGLFYYDLRRPEEEKEMNFYWELDDWEPA